MSVSLGILFGLLSMIGFGLNNAIAAEPARRIGTAKTFLYRNIVIVLLLLPVVTATGSWRFLAREPLMILLTLGISLVGYGAVVAFYEGLRVGKIGMVAPIGNSWALYTVLLAIVFYGDHLFATQAMAIVMILIGLLTMSLNIKDLRNSDLFNCSTGVPFAFIASVIWGVVFFLWKIPVAYIGPVMTSFIIELGGVFWSYLQLKKQGGTVVLEEKSLVRHLIVIGLCGVCGSLFYTIGISKTSVSVVAVLASASPVIATLYGKIVHNERLTKVQYVAGALIVMGIILIILY